jgi:low affinity Fe/Cu permease
MLRAYTWCVMVLHRLSRRPSVDNVKTRDNNKSNMPKQSALVSATITQNNEIGLEQQQQQSSSIDSTTQDSSDTYKPQTDSSINNSADGHAPSTVGKTVGNKDYSLLKKLTQQPQRALRGITTIVSTVHALVHTMLKLQCIARLFVTVQCSSGAACAVVVAVIEHSMSIDQVQLLEHTKAWQLIYDTHVRIAVCPELL